MPFVWSPQCTHSYSADQVAVSPVRLAFSLVFLNIKYKGRKPSLGIWFLASFTCRVYHKLVWKYTLPLSTAGVSHHHEYCLCHPLWEVFGCAVMVDPVLQSLVFLIYHQNLITFELLV